MATLALITRSFYLIARALLTELCYAQWSATAALISGHNQASRDTARRKRPKRVFVSGWRHVRLFRYEQPALQHAANQREFSPAISAATRINRTTANFTGSVGHVAPKPTSWILLGIGSFDCGWLIPAPCGVIDLPLKV